jgi:hypothetical protein
MSQAISLAADNSVISCQDWLGTLSLSHCGE